MHQHQEKAAAGRIHVCLFSVHSAIAFLNCHNCAASEQQAEKPPCLSLTGRAAAAGLSCLTIACHSLEGLCVPRATPVSPCVGCAHRLCTPVILCVEQLLALTPPSLSRRDVPIYSCGLNHTSLTMPVLYLVATLEGRLSFMAQVLQTSCKCCYTSAGACSGCAATYGALHLIASDLS